MNQSSQGNFSRSRWFRIVAVSVVVGIPLVGFALEVLDKVLSGHGLDTYYSYSLFEWNYVGALVTLVAVSVAFLVAALFMWRERSVRRDIERKHDRSKIQS